VPEAKDAIADVKRLIALKKQLITAGKTGAATATPAPEAGPRTRTLSTGKTIIEDPEE
jgi:hypothetical protein